MTCTECPKPVLARGLCKAHYSRWRRAQGVDLPRVLQAVCARCGAVFTRADNSRKVYCTPTCHAAAKAERYKDRGRTRWPSCPVSVRTCTSCGRLFTARRASTTRCHPRCKLPAPMLATPCHYCSTPVLHPPTPGTRRRVCAPCKALRKKQADRLRRQIKRGAQGGERFDRAEVMERDAWTCHLCTQPIPTEAVWPDPMSQSLDHLVPVSLGGLHTRENVKAAHLGCNIRRQARPLITLGG